jgi:uncharacterized protein with von Willebrand factor type A (vWA) domain
MGAWQRFRPEELETLARSLDCLVWSRVLDKNEAIRKRLPRRADKYAGADIFQTLFQFEPKLKGEAIDPAMNAWLAAQLSSPAIRKLRESVMGDANKASFAAIKLFSELMRRKESSLKTILETAAQLDITRALAEESPELASKTLEMIEKVQQQLKDQVMEEASSVDLDSMESPKTGDFSHALKEHMAMESAAKTVGEDMEAVAEFASICSPSSGWSDDAGERLIEFGLDEQLMSRMKNQDEFREILKAVGRLKKLAGRIKSRKPKPASARMGLTQGADLQRLVPQELVYLSDPDLEDIFWMKHSQRGLTLYDNKKRIPEGKGPMIMCLDVSGSMTGLRERMSKAMMLQLVRTAFEQNRQVAWLMFGTQSSPITEITESRHLLSLFGSQRHQHLGGGTNFGPPLEAAMNYIEGTDGARESGDIIFLSDGYGPLYGGTIARWERMREELGTRMIGCLFDGKWPDEVKKLMSASLEVDTAGNLDWAEELLDVVM